MYSSGEGVDQDYSVAAQWFRKSAEQGYYPAQYNLGNSYLNGKGVDQDYSVAVQWFTKSAEQGFLKAQFNLGGAL